MSLKIRVALPNRVQSRGVCMGLQISRNISKTEFITPPPNFLIQSSTRYSLYTYKISETLTEGNFNKFIFSPKFLLQSLISLLSLRPHCYHSNTQFASFERLCLKYKDYAIAGSPKFHVFFTLNKSILCIKYSFHSWRN
jgi:hypothetical protein